MKSNFSQAIESVKNVADRFMDQAANSITNDAKTTLDQLGNLVGESGQTLSGLTTNLKQAVSELNEATAALKTSVVEATDEAARTITKTSNQAASAFKETTAQATAVLNQTTNVTLQTFDQATNLMAQTAEKTKLAFDETLQKSEQLSGAISTSVQDVVSKSVKAWLTDHPIVSWSVAHPLWSIALVVFVLFLCWSLLGAIAQLTQQTWIALLQAPFRLTQLLSRKVFQAFQPADGVSSAKPESQQEVQSRLSKILSRLEALRQEEEALMKEMQALLISKHCARAKSAQPSPLNKSAAGFCNDVAGELIAGELTANFLSDHRF